MRILGIETSCDESALSLIEAQGTFGPDFRFSIISEALASQAALHAQYGGVFPNLAKREHAKALVPLLSHVLHEGGSTPCDEAALRELLHREPELCDQLVPFFRTHAKPQVDAIAVTAGPGLEPALWVGVNFAKALAHAWELPLVAVNHMEGHIIISLMESAEAPERARLSGRMSTFEFPVLALLISGGHTELVDMHEFDSYRIVGRTRDDAAGEAFDKAARLLGLSYPGGPEISRLARDARETGTPPQRLLPRPMLHEDNLDFSFSGLKTAVLRHVEGTTLSDTEKVTLAREFEDAVADVLVGKTMRAIDEYGSNTLVVGGGVSANTHIREQLASALEREGGIAKLLVPPPALATDNALMIALAGYFHAAKGEFVQPDALQANGNLALGQIVL